MNKIKIIFFDIDNTLLDHKGAELKALYKVREKYFPNTSEEEFENVWIFETKKNWKLFEEKKLTFEEQRTQRIIDVWSRFGKKITSKKAKEIFKEYLFFYEESWKLFPMVKDVLNSLKASKIKLGIISNGDRNQQIKKLKSIKIHSLIEEDLLIASGDMKISKPNPEIFIYAQSATTYKAEEILMVGDNLEQDIEPAKKLGWNTLYVNHFSKLSGQENNFSKILEIAS
jgi:putative hydrolase of the HAD superfamily